MLNQAQTMGAPGASHLGAWETKDLRAWEVDDHSQDRSW
jgi:hypothetical protein